MDLLLDSMLNSCASLFCLKEFRSPRQMSAKVHASLAHKPTPCKISVQQTINDRLRMLMGDIISEEQLEKRLTFGRMLGSGATSKVYEAVDTMTGARVSVKEFDKTSMVETRSSMVADGEYIREKAVHRARRRLMKLVFEIEISQTLDHPNIIKYLTAFETSHRICIVYEFVDGSDLLEYLLENGKMTEKRAVGVFRQLLLALEYCHSRNIFHRDLKLENVMITKTMQVKLIDFGLSEVAVDAKQPLRTVCGTPLYCSPEILLFNISGGRKGFFGGPADVWSVGVLIFALLTGCAPFDDSDFQRLRQDVTRNRINFPAYISSHVKGLLRDILVIDAQLRPTVTDLLSNSWFQNLENNEILVTKHNDEKPITVEGDEELLCSNNEGMLQLDISSPSLSCCRTSKSAGTCSSSASFEVTMKRSSSSPIHYFKETLRNL
ncbi:hypothetical protein PsorP6_008580 [Peronosclerospora sorghi]|uniref:Uncharacterized protein n=1 Tax=Peronosclerospora sorghi TaxID=230839 RepID=A0ACC0WB69_9STRA|nr:hypothetical protein PsorP6_008580 [Peronosclerospora sorghi]